MSPPWFALIYYAIRPNEWHSSQSTIIRATLMLQWKKNHILSARFKHFGYLPNLIAILLFFLLSSLIAVGVFSVDADQIQVNSMSGERRVRREIINIYIASSKYMWSKHGIFVDISNVGWNVVCWNDDAFIQDSTCANTKINIESC